MIRTKTWLDALASLPCTDFDESISVPINDIMRTTIIAHNRVFCFASLGWEQCQNDQDLSKRQQFYRYVEPQNADHSDFALAYIHLAAFELQEAFTFASAPKVQFFAVPDNVTSRERYNVKGGLCNLIWMNRVLAGFGEVYGDLCMYSTLPS